MDTLRRTLYLQAAVWAIAGIALAAVPEWLLPHLFGQPFRLSREVAWIRLLGVESIGLSMLMVLVAHRVEELWWWSWAFAMVNVAFAAIVVLNAGFGLEEHESRIFWWTFSGVAVAFALGMLYGLFVSSREQPIP
jgi:hypothetical protein